MQHIKAERAHCKLICKEYKETLLVHFTTGNVFKPPPLHKYPATPTTSKCATLLTMPSKCIMHQIRNSQNGVLDYSSSCTEGYNIGNLHNISKVINRSAECILAQLVSDQDCSSTCIVHKYNWTDLFCAKLKKVNGLRISTTSTDIFKLETVLFQTEVTQQNLNRLCACTMASTQS